MALINDEKENNGYTPIEFNPGDDPKKRQGNYVEDFNDLPEVESKPPEGKSSTMASPEDLINAIYTPPPKPYFDTEAAEYKQRAAKLNALGQGLSGIADILSLAQGGQVNAPVRNNKVQTYLNDYWNQRADHARRMDEWGYRDAANKSMANRIALNQWNSDRAYGLQRDNAAQDAAMKQLQLLQKEGYNQWLKDKHAQDSEESRRRWEIEMDWKMKLPYINAALDQQKMYSRLQYDDEKKAYTLLDSNGIPRHRLVGDGEIQKLYTLIASDPKMKESVDSRMKVLKSQFGEGVNMNHMKVIVSEYWDAVPNATQYLSRGQRKNELSEQEKSNVNDYLRGYSARPNEYPLNNATNTPPPATQEDWSQYELN